MSAPNPFGESYLEAQVFMQSAKMFGCAAAIVGMDQTGLDPILAAASRAVDVECGRGFSSGQISENHPWNPNTRQIKINQPPVSTLISYGIRVGAGLVSSFSVTPVEADANASNIRFGSVYYNRQENYLEVTSLALATSLISSVVALGLTTPQVEIVYTSLATVPPEVALAVGFTAAQWLNNSMASSMILPGIASFKDDDTEIRRAPVDAGMARMSVPTDAKALLRGYKRIAIG